MKWHGILFFWLLMSFSANAADAVSGNSTPPGCPAGDCGLTSAKPYAHIVVGKPLRILSEAEMRDLYTWAKAAGVWRDFADSEADYLARNLAILLPTGAEEGAEGSAVLVHMSSEEYRRAVFDTNNLVRYTPGMYMNLPVSERPEYHSDLDGCVAVLCSGMEASCTELFRAGVFRRSDGVQLDPTSGLPLAGGVTIDPDSMLPRAAEAAQQ
jgi:hypothetical protein